MMEPDEAAEILAEAAAYDGRTTGRADAMAWARALDGLRVTDCVEAINNYYRDHTERIMPAHVRAEVRHIRDQRLEGADRATIPDVDPDDVAGYLAALRATREAIGDGTVPVPALGDTPLNPRLLQLLASRPAKTPPAAEPETTEATEATPARPVRPPWCGECDDDHTRLVPAEGGTVRRCPRCHPLVAPAKPPVKSTRDLTEDELRAIVRETNRQLTALEAMVVPADVRDPSLDDPTTWPPKA